MVASRDNHEFTDRASRTSAADLRHRFRNAIALVEILALRTLLDSRDYEQFRTALAGRLRAVSRAEDRLLADRWQYVTFGELVAESLEVARADEARVRLDGVVCDVASDQILALSLILHELGTNAMRHGALADASGTVSITWTVVSAEPPRLEFTWRESGGRATAAPLQRGYGLELVESLCTGDLGGDLTQRFHASGFLCTVSIPLRTGLTARDGDD